MMNSVMLIWTLEQTIKRQIGPLPLLYIIRNMFKRTNLHFRTSGLRAKLLVIRTILTVWVHFSKFFLRSE